MRAASRPDRRDGYATVSALVISLAIGVAVTAAMAVAHAELRAARTELHRARVEGLLNGVHLRAAYDIAASPGANRLAWAISTAEGPVTLLAEHEGGKAPLEQAHELLTDDVLRRLGADPEAARGHLRLAALSRQTARESLMRAPFGPAWRACILSLVSPLGYAQAIQLEPPQAPGAGQLDWRTGQVWRVRARSGDGWTDDRLVRWSGRGRAPTAVIERAFYREGGSEVRCDTLDD